MKHTHDSREFFIDDNMILIRPLVASDSIADKRYKDFIDNSDYVVVGEINFAADEPFGDYNATDTGNSAVFIAVIEKDTGANISGSSDKPVGIALYVENPITRNHELSILVNPDYVDTRLTLELMDSLVFDAAENGVQTLTTEDSNDDTHMQHIAKKLGMSARLDTNKFRHTRYTLQVDKHPGVVVF